ncbi:MAG: HNH endonuclease [Frankia sp.]|nr:HNH endonuclease [Frankia sp.]
MAKVDKEGAGNGCWLWTGYRDRHGYGQVRRQQRTHLVHRLVLAEKLGRPIAEGMECLHSCDNPGCVNPEHLSEGTHADNMRDCAEKDRANSGPGVSRNVGSANPAAKLDPEKVRAIRAAGGPQTAIAAAFGLRQQTVSDIRRRRIWAHVE